jgi:hypothetical protein
MHRYHVLESHSVFLYPSLRRFISSLQRPLTTENSPVLKAPKRIYGVYRKQGFCVTMILGDSEFECTRGTVATDLRSELNICGEDEHIPDIERCIRTTKERTRCH